MPPHVSGCPWDTSRTRRTVVGHEHDHGVLPLPCRFKGFANLTDAAIDRGDHGGIHLHVACCDSLLVRSESGPVGNPEPLIGRNIRENSVVRYQAEFLLAFESSLADLGPTLGVHTGELRDVFFRCVERCVNGTVGEIQEERLVRAAVPKIPDHADGPVGQVGCQVVVVRVFVDREVMVVFDELVRVKEIGETIKESVEAIEALLEWSPMFEASGRLLDLTREMPFPDGEGGVSRIPER